MRKSFQWLAFWDDVVYYRDHITELLTVADGKKRKRSFHGRTVSLDGDRPLPECQIEFDKNDLAGSAEWSHPVVCLIDEV